MSRVHATRADRAVITLLGVLFVALAAGLFCGPAGAAEARSGVQVSDEWRPGAAPTSRGPTGPAQRADAAAQVAGPAVIDDGVGCGKSKRHDRDAQQNNPSRSNPAAELLAAFAHAHAATDLCAPAAHAPAPAKDRAPPPLEPPTPVSLSVLRV
ncbi:hypothetical protein [Streptomyces sp. YIM 130001]|uniref:hypothetical protein n=1 Tax=Streptomyces sp. YIM 130001 TaxID=2259644 RepID=UPI0013C3FFAB|nr:hypothetical protein [Streptomyces sp. YIM 130001]